MTRSLRAWLFAVSIALPCVVAAGGRASETDPATDGASCFGPDIASAYEATVAWRLIVPVAGVAAGDLYDTWGEARGEGRGHQGIDISSAVGTPVLAAGDGIIARLFESRLGGRTIYQFDPFATYVYYYAHLDRYAPGLEAGDRVAQGNLIGFVGTTGNATTPHLHFEIGVLDGAGAWWQSDPINPYDVLVK